VVRFGTARDTKQLSHCVSTNKFTTLHHQSILAGIGWWSCTPAWYQCCLRGTGLSRQIGEDPLNIAITHVYISRGYLAAPTPSSTTSRGRVVYWCSSQRIYATQLLHPGSNPTGPRLPLCQNRGAGGRTASGGRRAAVVDKDNNARVTGTADILHQLLE